MTRLRLDADRFDPVLRRAYDDIEYSVAAAMSDVEAGLKDELREQIVAAGMSSRLAKTWRGKRFPEGRPSINATAFVWSRAADIVDAFDKGVPIVARQRKYLAIPTPDAGVRQTSERGRRLTPAIWEAETGVALRFVPRGNHALLVTDGFYVRQPARWRRRKGFAPMRNGEPSGKRAAVIFVLVPQVGPRKRFDVDGAANRWAGRVDGLIARHWL
jgi:hypothetical protein